MRKLIGAIALLLICTTSYGQESGTLIIFQGGIFSRAIKKHTGSDYTHVTIILDGYAYQSTWPEVQKMPVKEYRQYIKKRLKRKKRLKVWVLTPKKNYSKKQVGVMREFAESQLGRRYQLRGWWLNRETRGVHCSQFASQVLGKVSPPFKSDIPWRIAPIHIYNIAKPLYTVTSFK